MNLQDLLNTVIHFTIIFKLSPGFCPTTFDKDALNRRGTQPNEPVKK